MKNKFQIYAIVVLLFYFLSKLLKIKVFTESIWYEIISFIAIISLAFFESKRLLEVDELNKTNKFKHRILLVLSALILFIVVKTYLVN